MAHTHDLAFVFPRDPEQVVARCQANLAAVGVDIDDPAQRRAFLVGALGGYGSAQRSLQSISAAASLELAHVAAHWGAYILRIARDGGR